MAVTSAQVRRDVVVDFAGFQPTGSTRTAQPGRARPGWREPGQGEPGQENLDKENPDGENPARENPDGQWSTRMVNPGQPGWSTRIPARLQPARGHSPGNVLKRRSPSWAYPGVVPPTRVLTRKQRARLDLWDFSEQLSCRKFFDPSYGLFSTK